MALARKTLVNVNDAIIIQMIDPFDRNGAAEIQVFSGGGTIVMEATNDDAILPNQQINVSAVWVQLTNLLDATGATVSSITGAGAVRAEIVGYRFVRARESVKAGANNDVALNVRIN